MDLGNFGNFLLVIGLPGLASIVGWLFMKPTQEEMRVSNLRKSLRLSIRFQISYSIASIVPIKQKNISQKDYISMCSDE